MEALGILGLFSNPYFGGFGSDFCSGDTVDTWKDRAELVRIAARRCDELHGELILSLLIMLSICGGRGGDLLTHF